MEICIGLSKWWDSSTYPRVGQWPLPIEKENALLAEYANLLKAAYATYESWKRWGFLHNLDCECFVQAKLDCMELPERVWVVLGVHPEEITWSGETYPYRLRIEIAWCSKRKSTPAFASLKEVQDFAQECIVAKPKSRFTVVELAVVS